MLIDQGALWRAIFTLVATILLGMVAFDVPYFKSVYYLRAALPIPNLAKVYYVDFGTLGFCGFFQGEALNCTLPKIGYEIDPNVLFDNTSQFTIPIVIVKWLTSALFIHVIAFAITAISLAFAIISMLDVPCVSCITGCCTTIFTSFAGFVAVIAFAFDLAFFFLIKDRVIKENQGGAIVGNAIYMTIVAWILLFLSPCIYIIGKCTGAASRATKF